MIEWTVPQSCRHELTSGANPGTRFTSSTDHKAGDLVQGVDGAIGQVLGRIAVIGVARGLVAICPDDDPASGAMTNDRTREMS